MKHFTTGLAAGVFAATLSLAAAPAAAETYIVAVGASSNSLQGRSAAKFAEDLQARLGDAHTVEFYADGQLGDEKELLQKLRLGTVQFTLVSSIMTNVAPEFALFDMPFLVQSREHLKAIDAEIVQTDLAPKAEEGGLKVLSTWENGFRQITNSARPINTPADLEGLKIRTPSSEWRVAMFKEWGGKPDADVFLGSLRCAANRHYGRSGKSADQHHGSQFSGSAEISEHDGTRLFTDIPDNGPRDMECTPGRGDRRCG